MTTQQVVAVFDFDDTIIRGESLRDFLLRSFTPLRILGGFLCSLPTYVAYCVHLATLRRAKERLLTCFLGGMTVDELVARCDRYNPRLDTLVDARATARIRWHQELGHTVIIASASLEHLLVPWAKHHDINTVIATRLEVQNGIVTGRLFGPNCAGPEKVRRVLELFPERQRYEFYVYGDGKTDEELLAFADHPYRQSFA